MRHDKVLGSIPNMVRVCAEKFGDNIAVVDDGVELTYRELGQAMLDATRAMIALGVQPGDRVALCAPNSAAWIQAALGIQGAGGVLVPVNTRFKGDEIGHMLTKSGAVAFICVSEFLGNDYIAMVRESAPGVRALDRLVTLDGAEVEGATAFSDLLRQGRESVAIDAAHSSIDAVKPDDLSDIMFTSGTTGAPKGVKITHAQSLRAYGNLGNILALRPADGILVIPPFFHAFGYKAGWMMGLVFGMTVIPQRTFEPRQILEKIQAHRVACMFGPPTIFADLMGYPARKDYDYSSLRVAVVSAASIPAQLIHDLKAVLEFDTVMSGYGLTESSAVVSICRPTDSPERVATTAGQPIDDVEVKSVDENANDLPAGAEGELMVRGYNVMSGYWEEPEQTAQAITPDGWLRTGDIGVVDEAGYIRITDRKKDMFIVGGFNAYPAEIENILSRFGKILQVAVVGIPDARMGEVGVAYVIPAPGSGLTAQEVLSYARKHLANFKVPRKVFIVDDLPRNGSLKVLKHVLREQALAGSSELPAD